MWFSIVLTSSADGTSSAWVSALSWAYGIDSATQTGVGSPQVSCKVFYIYIQKSPEDRVMTCQFQHSMNLYINIYEYDLKFNNGDDKTPATEVPCGVLMPHFSARLLRSPWPSLLAPCPTSEGSRGAWCDLAACGQRLNTPPKKKYQMTGWAFLYI